VWRMAHSEKWSRVFDVAPLPRGIAALVIALLSAVCWAILMGIALALWSAV
jgi:hypothetical protein